MNSIITSWKKTTALAFTVAMIATTNTNAVSLKIGMETPITLANKIGFTYNDGVKSYSYNIKIGALKATDINNPNDTFVTFCTDVGVTLRYGNVYQYDVVPFVGQTGARPSWQPNGIQYAAYLVDHNLQTVDDNNINGTALQVAIWEALYDTGTYDLANGRFKLWSATPEVYNQANYYLNQLNGLQSVPDYIGMWYRPDPLTSSQGLLRVPEAGSSLAFMSIGLIGLATVNRKIRK